MISETFATSRVSLFARLRNFPTNPDSKGRLIRAFQHAFQTEREADDFVNQWIAEQRHCPYEADIWEAGKALKATNSPQGFVRSDGCALCSQTPHTPGWLHLSDEGQGASTPCVCRGGNPKLREQAEFMIQKWRQHPLGDSGAVPVTVEQLKAKLRDASFKRMPKAPRLSDRASEIMGKEVMRAPACMCQLVETDSGSFERIPDPKCQRSHAS
jgi:hypothetical protein